MYIVIGLQLADLQKKRETSGVRQRRTPKRKEVDASAFVEAESKKSGRWGRKQELKNPAHIFLVCKDT